MASSQLVHFCPSDHTPLIWLMARASTPTTMKYFFKSKHELAGRDGAFCPSDSADHLRNLRGGTNELKAYTKFYRVML